MNNKDKEMKCDTKSNSDVTIKPTNDQLLKCYKCDIMFKKVSELNYHNKINHKTRVKNDCFNCEMMFEDYENFRSHVETMHKVNDKYKCDKCPKETKDYKCWLNHTKYCKTSLTRGNTSDKVEKRLNNKEFLKFKILKKLSNAKNFK